MLFFLLFPSDSHTTNCTSNDAAAHHPFCAATGTATCTSFFAFKASSCFSTARCKPRNEVDVHKMFIEPQQNNVSLILWGRIPIRMSLTTRLRAEKFKRLRERTLCVRRVLCDGEHKQHRSVQHMPTTMKFFWVPSALRTS